MEYNSYESLAGKTLNYRDTVTFTFEGGKTFNYRVKEDHLDNRSGSNEAIFEFLDMTEKKKFAFAAQYYGYAVDSGSWPCSRNNDQVALTRLALAIFAGIEGIETDFTFEVDREEIIIHKETKKVKAPTKFNKISIAVKLNSDYDAEIKSKLVDVRGNRITKNKMMEFMKTAIKAWELKPEDVFKS